MRYTKEAFGSVLTITLFDSHDSGISESFLEVKNFEEQYSRFIPKNELANINIIKTGVLPDYIISAIKASIQVSKLTDGYYDMTILPILENAGYGKEKVQVKESIGYKHICLQNNTIYLENDIFIEFGSFGKGLMLDRIYTILEKFHSEFVIDFGGDMRVKGLKNIILEDPRDTSKSLGTVLLTNASIASSSGNRRTFHSFHHLINPFTKISQNEVLGVCVTHRLGVFADIFATALFVTPLEKSLQILEQVSGLEGYILDSKGKLYSTPNFIQS